MDELDVKIFRALVSESIIAPSNNQVMSSLRDIARKLGSDDMTVRNRFKKIQDAGCMSVWHLAVNPSFFGYRALNVRVEAQPESAKTDMMRKLKLVHGVVTLVNYLGTAMRIMMLYDTDESRARTVELISRITNAEKVTLFRMVFPMSETKRFTETDIAIIRSLTKDARKPYTTVAKELGLSGRTVKNRLDKMRAENTLFTVPELNMGDVAGLIPADLSYSYTGSDVKDSVDSEMLSHFDANYLWGGFSDPERAFLVLSFPTIAEVTRSLDWVKEQPGVATAQLDIGVACVNFTEKMAELIINRKPEQLA